MKYAEKIGNHLQTIFFPYHAMVLLNFREHLLREFIWPTVHESTENRLTSWWFQPL